MPNTFTTKIAIKAPIAAVWDALATEEGISKWFLSKAKLDVQKGGDFEFFWGDISTTGKFLDVVPQKKLSFTWWEPVGAVTFELEKLNDAEVAVICTATGYQTEGDGLKHYIEESKGWTFFIINLKIYLEHKLDLRDSNPMRTCQTGWLNSSAG
jgi:uncharacterized protein YndB with AHSA1/START domain